MLQPSFLLRVVTDTFFLRLSSIPLGFLTCPRSMSQPMDIQSKGQNPQRFRSHSVMGAIAVSMTLAVPMVQAQSARSLRPACVGIASGEAMQEENSCCQKDAKGKCLTLDQAFPTPKNTESSVGQSRNPYTNVRFSRPKASVYGNRTTGSEGAAKDAVIQMGVTKAWDAITPAFKASKKESKSSGDHNFFEKARQDYERVFRPRELESGAILTPKLDVDFSSMKAGVNIQF